MPDSWYRITNAERSGGTARVDLYDEIGFYGVDAATFSKDLRELDASTIELHVNSPGGSAFDGIAILNALRQHPARVVAVVDGIAASAASFITAGADEVRMAPNSSMMIHEASGVAYGPAATMQKMSEELDSLSANIASIYAARTSTDTSVWRAAMLAETWYSAEEAVAAGLADRVLPVPDRRPAPEDVAHAPGDARSRWAVNGRRAASAWKYPDRAAAPSPLTPVASAPGNAAVGGTIPEEVARVSELLNGLRSRLGLADTADETAALAALDEALTERADPPANTAPPTNALPDGHTAVPQVALDELRAQAAQGASAHRQLHEQNRAATLDRLRDRFLPANRASWEREYDRDPAATVTYLEGAPVLVPTSEIGHGQDPTNEIEDATYAALFGAQKGA